MYYTRASLSSEYSADNHEPNTPFCSQNVRFDSLAVSPCTVPAVTNCHHLADSALVSAVCSAEVKPFSDPPQQPLHHALGPMGKRWRRSLRHAECPIGIALQALPDWSRLAGSGRTEAGRLKRPEDHLDANMAFQIPEVQQAAIIQNPGENATVRIIADAPVATPGPHEILVKLAFTGLWYVLHR